MRQSLGELEQLVLAPEQQAKLERGNALVLFPRFA
jgi:hypothetical protein